MQSVGHLDLPSVADVSYCLFYAVHRVYLCGCTVGCTETPPLFPTEATTTNKHHSYRSHQVVFRHW